MENPFSAHYTDKSDLELIQAATSGSMAALEALVARHQHYIYNVALKLVGSAADAQDITQEVLIKVITKLAQFSNESSFRTWLYRITFNHFLQMKKTAVELQTKSFEQVGDELDQIENEELTTLEMAEWQREIEETKLTCMSGMLMCLEREQRLVFILGEVFRVNHSLGAEFMSISKDNFRQKLARARRDLYNFMNRKCGLVNTANPCRCAAKTKGFVKAGKVDPVRMQFNTGYLQKISAIAPQKLEELDDFIDEKHAALFREHPFQEATQAAEIFKRLTRNQPFSDLLNADSTS